MLKNKKLLKLIAVLTVLVLSICLLTGCGNSDDKEKSGSKEKTETASYEEPLKNYIKGMAEADADKFLKAFPDFIAEYMEDIFTDETLEEAVTELEDEYGANIEMSYKVTGKEEISEDELTEQEEDVKTNYDEEVEITKGYELEVELTIKGDDSEETDSDTISVYEVDGKWCILEL